MRADYLEQRDEGNASTAVIHCMNRVHGVPSTIITVILSNYIMILIFSCDRARSPRQDTGERASGFNISAVSGNSRSMSMSKAKRNLED